MCNRCNIRCRPVGNFWGFIVLGRKLLSATSRKRGFTGNFLSRNWNVFFVLFGFLNLILTLYLIEWFGQNIKILFLRTKNIGEVLKKKEEKKSPLFLFYSLKFFGKVLRVGGGSFVLKERSKNVFVFVYLQPQDGLSWNLIHKYK